MAQQRSVVFVAALIVASSHAAGPLASAVVSKLPRSRVQLVAQAQKVSQEEGAASQLAHSVWATWSGAWSYLRTSIWGAADGTSIAADHSSSARAASALVEQLDRRLAAKDYDRAAALLDPSVDWATPSWKAKGHVALKASWASGIDDKWGVTPVWRSLRETADESVFTRECDTFRVLGWPIRLRQTFHMRRKGFGLVVLKATIERL